MRNRILDIKITNSILKNLEEAKNICRIDQEKAHDIYLSVYETAKKNKLYSMQGYSLIGLALVSRIKSEVNECIKYSYSALEIFEKTHEIKGKVQAINLLGVAYYYSAMYEQALNYLFQALDIIKEHEDDYLKSCILNNIGEVFREAGRYEDSLECYHKALKYAYKNKAIYNVASIFNNIGEIQFVQHKYKEAVEYYAKGYELLINQNDMIMLGEVENNIGKVHLINMDYDKAQDFFSDAIGRLEKINNKYYIIDAYMNMAKLKTMTNNKECFLYFEKAIIVAKESKAQKKLATVYKTMAEFYELKGNYQEALKYYKEYHIIDQAITISSTGEKLEILKMEFEHITEKEELKKFKFINQRLETEIYNKKNELEYILNLNKNLEEEVNIDELTGIPNRRYINNTLKIKFNESLKEDISISIFIIDIDKFKKFNDNWGHSRGDECLKKVAGVFEFVKFGKNHVIGRYGGEEFIYYAKGLDYEESLLLGKKLKNEVEKLGLKYNDDENSPVLTISLGGIVSKAGKYASIFEMIDIADRELYKVKNSGRNAVSIAPY